MYPFEHIEKTAPYSGQNHLPFYSEGKPRVLDSDRKDKCSLHCCSVDGV